MHGYKVINGKCETSPQVPRINGVRNFVSPEHPNIVMTDPIAV